MIFMEYNLSQWTNEEIKALIELNSKRKKSYEKATLVSEELNPLIEQLNEKRKRCNEIIANEEHITKESSQILYSDSLDIRKLNKSCDSLKGILKDCFTAQQSVNVESKKLVASANHQSLKVDPFREYHYNGGFKKLVEDVIKLKKCYEKYRTAYKKNLELYKAGKISKEFCINEGEKIVSNMTMVSSSAKEKEKIIVCYNKIKENIEFIMNYNIERIKEKRKHCSSNQYKKFINDICEKIKEKNAEILMLSDNLPTELFEELKGLYDINKIQIVSDKIAVEERKDIIVNDSVNESKKMSYNPFKFGRNKAQVLALQN